MGGRGRGVGGSFTWGGTVSMIGGAIDDGSKTGTNGGCECSVVNPMGGG